MSLATMAKPGRPSGVIGWALTRSNPGPAAARPRSSAARNSRMWPGGGLQPRRTHRPRRCRPSPPGPAGWPGSTRTGGTPPPWTTTLDPDGGPDVGSHQPSVPLFPGRGGGRPAGVIRNPGPAREGPASAYSVSRSLTEMSRRSASAASRSARAGGQHHGAMHVVVVLPRFVARLRHAGSSRRAAGLPRAARRSDAGHGR